MNNTPTLYSEGIVGVSIATIDGKLTVWRGGLREGFIRSGNMGRLPLAQWFVDGTAVTPADARKECELHDEKDMVKL